MERSLSRGPFLSVDSIPIALIALAAVGRRRSSRPVSYAIGDIGFPFPKIAYVYARETKAQADTAKVLTMDEARRIAANIARLPKLLGN